MSGLSPLAVLVGATLLSLVVVAAARLYAERRGVLDVPNERSSHTRPTPRGGGIGVVATVLVAMALVGPWPGTIMLLAAAAVLLVAAIGWIDDHGDLPVGGRLVVHVMAGLLVAWLALHTASSTAVPTLWVAVAGAWWVFWTVSAINVVNFMDGSDALIGLQGAIFGGFAWLALAGAGSPGVDAAASASFGLAVTGAFLGFLVLNRPPARIFMGDVGSGAAGVVLVLLGLLVLRARDWSIVAAYLPLGPLFVDELVTMVRRVRSGKDIRVAHKSHYYQRLIQQGWGHGAVAVLYGALALPGAAIALTLGGHLLPVVLAGALYVAAAGFLLHRLAGLPARPARG